MSRSGCFESEGVAEEVVALADYDDDAEKWDDDAARDDWEDDEEDEDDEEEDEWDEDDDEDDEWDEDDEEDDSWD